MKREQDSPRLDWIDASRGVCVAAVVLFHVCLWHYLPLSDQLWQPAVTGWSKVNNYLASLRMPLLLAISGLLASRRIQQGWRSPGALVRAGSSYYLYFVWLVIYFVVYLSIPGARVPHRIQGPGQFALELVIPQTPLWYIFALAVFVLVLTALRRVPPWIVLTGLAFLSISVVALNPDWGTSEKIPENAIYFAIGVYGGNWMKALASRHSLRELLFWLGFGLAAVVSAKWNYPEPLQSIFGVARGAVFIGVGIVVVSALVRIQWIARFATAIGRQTLQIYVMHVPLILYILALQKPEWVASLRPVLVNPVFSAAWPIVLTVMIISLSLALHTMLLRARLGFLFEMPAPLKAAIIALHLWFARLRARRPKSSPVVKIPS